MTTKSITQAIGPANERLMQVIAAGDWQGIAACYTAQAQLLAPNLPRFKGRDAIIEFFKGIRGSGIAHIHLTTTEVDDQGDTGIEVGDYWLEADNGERADEGKYLVVWKHEADGWKLHRDMMSSDLPST